MLSLPLFRSLIPSHNPLGFGAVDFVELFLAVMFFLFGLSQGGRLERRIIQFASHTWASTGVLAAVPVLLRMLLLRQYPAPFPNVADEWSHLLVAHTLRHFRLANPPHAYPRFFETFFTLQTPTYSSIYPLGQGLALAMGRLLLGSPWAGVVLSTALFCGLSYWMLRGWVSPPWALAGGCITVMEFGPLSQWMNSYWGGAFAAAGGCLVFGALPRIQESAKRRDAVLLTLGLAIDLFTRPYESVFLFLATGVFLLTLCERWTARRVAPIVLVGTLAAIGVMLLQNKQVTNSWTTLPYSASQYQYGVPVSLTLQPTPVPHRTLTPQQESEYQIQNGFKAGGESVGRYFQRLRGHAGNLAFFLMPALFPVLLGALMRLREVNFTWAVATLVVSILGTNLFPAFHFHYLAPVTCLFVLMSVAGLEQISKVRWRGFAVGQEASRLVFFLCAAQFLFWYGVHLFGRADSLEEVTQYESWDALNNPRPVRRIAVRETLDRAPGKQLVFVRYYPQHPSQDEWVWNEANIDEARVVWARDLGSVDNENLRQYYPGRTAWLLEPDFRPLPRLQPYHPD